MYLGIDIGTSAVKAAIVDEAGEVVDQAAAALDVSRPQPLWSEQNPVDWWSAANNAVAACGHCIARPCAPSGCRARCTAPRCSINRRQPLRPAIFWNDGRSADQCAELESGCAGHDCNHRQPCDAGIHRAEITVGKAA